MFPKPVAHHCFLGVPRVNISNAALFGLKTDLHLGGTQFNQALVVL